MLKKLVLLAIATTLLFGITTKSWAQKPQDKTMTRVNEIEQGMIEKFGNGGGDAAVDAYLVSKGLKKVKSARIQPMVLVF